jgi:hypothetical protein
MAMALARLLALVLLVIARPLLAADPHAPQLAVSFLAEPAPIAQDGSTRLVYEMQIVNYSRSPISTCISTTSLRSWPATACLGEESGPVRRT